MYNLESKICVGDVEVEALVGFTCTDPFDCPEPRIVEVWVKARAGWVALKQRYWPDSLRMEDDMADHARESENGHWADYRCDLERDRRMGA